MESQFPLSSRNATILKRCLFEANTIRIEYLAIRIYRCNILQATLMRFRQCSYKKANALPAQSKISTQLNSQFNFSKRDEYANDVDSKFAISQPSLIDIERFVAGQINNQFSLKQANWILWNNVIIRFFFLLGGADKSILLIENYFHCCFCLTRFASAPCLPINYVLKHNIYGEALSS